MEYDVDGIPHTVRVMGLLNRALLFMEEENFNGADALVEQALNLDPYSARAYIYKLMVQLEAAQEQDLPSKADKPLEQYTDFTRALRFADEVDKEWLQHLESQTLEALQARQQDENYDRAVKDLDKRENLEDIARLQAYFQSLGNYKQAPAMVLRAQQKAVWVRQKIENNRAMEQRRETWEKRKKILLVVVVVTTIVLTVIISAIANAAAKRAENNRLFEEAVAAMEAGEYEEALSLLSQVEHRTDIVDTQNEIKYRQAAQLLEEGSYAEAAEMFDELGGYNDSNIRRREAIYAGADEMYSNGMYAEAAEVFESLGTYSDSAERKTEATYAYGMELYTNGGIIEKEDGYVVLRQLGSYKNAEDMLLKDSCAEFFDNDGYIGYIHLGVWDEVYSNNELGMDPITWNVVCVEEGRALLLSNSIFLRQTDYWNEGDADWEDSRLREYLNGEFYDTVFNEAEKGIIMETEVPSALNEQYGTSSGPATQDRVFILSAEEVAKYVTNEYDLTATAIYSASQGSRSTAKYEDAWWLRTPGETPSTHAYVDESGQTVLEGVYNWSSVEGDIPGVRMAMWVDLDAMPKLDATEAA